MWAVPTAPACGSGGLRSWERSHAVGERGRRAFMLTTLISGAASSMDRLIARFLKGRWLHVARHNLGRAACCVSCTSSNIEWPITANNLSLREGT